MLPNAVILVKSFSPGYTMDSPGLDRGRTGFLFSVASDAAACSQHLVDQTSRQAVIQFECFGASKGQHKQEAQDRSIVDLH